MQYYEDDKYYNLWNEEHPQFRDWIDKMNHFAQGDGITEDDVDEFQGYFEMGHYEELCRRLDYLKDEVRDLYFAIDNAYDYIEKLKKTQKLVPYTFKKINGTDNDFDFTISKDDEILYTIHCHRENGKKPIVSEYPHFYNFNDYNKDRFNSSLPWLLNKNRLVLEFYERA